MPEGEAGAAEDDPERREGERDVERGHDRRERARERRPEKDEDEDQPDVIGLPHRPDGAIDLPAHLLGTSTAPGQEIPDAGAEVRASEDRVQGDPEPEHRRADVRGAHVEASEGGGLYGSSPSSA